MNVQMHVGEFSFMTGISSSFTFSRRTLFFQSSWKTSVETFRELGQLVWQTLKSATQPAGRHSQCQLAQ